MITAEVVDGDAVTGRVREFAAATGRALLTEVVLISRNLAVALANAQQPFGLSRASEAMGKARVAEDIGRVFLSPAGFYARLEKDEPQLAPQFWKAWRARDFAGMERVARASRAGGGLQVMSAPDPAVHGRRRGTRGRVHGKRASALVTDGAALKAYVRKIQARVGLTKAGWADAAEDCGGTRGIPVWAGGRHAGRGGLPRGGGGVGAAYCGGTRGTRVWGGGRHAGRQGGATVTAAGGDPEVVLENRVPWARDGLPIGVENQAVRIAEERLQRRMETILGIGSEMPF